MLVLVTDWRTVVRDVVIAAGAVVGAGDAVAAAAGWSGAFVACRFSLAKIVIPLKLPSVTAVASARSSNVEPMSGFFAGRGADVMRLGEHQRAARA